MLFAVIGPPKYLFYQSQLDSISLTWSSPVKGGGLAKISSKYTVKWTNNISDFEQNVTATTTELTYLIHNTNYVVEVFVTSNVNEDGFPAQIIVNTCKYIF